MSKKKQNTNLSDIQKTKRAINSDFIYTNAFYQILIDVFAPFYNNREYRKIYYHLLNFSKEAFIIALIASLSKLFDDKSGHLGLPTLIKQIQNLHPSIIERRNGKKYNEFIKKSDDYIKELKKIDRKISPLRNINRVHNFPDTKTEKKFYWEQLDELRKRAESIYKKALSAIDEPIGLPALYINIEDEHKELSEWAVRTLREK